MSEASVDLKRADGARSYVESLLEENGLPSQGVRANAGRFYVGRDGRERIGVGGIEPCGQAGLLRSVVVESAKRGRGYGAALCEALEAHAAASGVETLYLLTTTAPDFFADRGYVEIDRSEAPPAIRRTAEFDELCPATATCMRKSL